MLKRGKEEKRVHKRGSGNDQNKRTEEENLKQRTK